MYLVVVLVAESSVANVVDERREEVEVGEGAEREEVVQGFVSSLPSLPSRVTRAFLSPARLPSVPPSIVAGPSILDSGSLLLEPSTVPERIY